MSDQNLVSVVIPAFNAERTLGDTLASVRGQSHRELEIIVVDDGSTDGTAALAHAHAAEDPRIQVISVANGGVANARNTGIAASRGSFVAPVDADDLWHPEKIARQLAAMRAGGSEIGYVYTYYRLIDGRGFLIGSAGYAVEGEAFLRSVLLNAVGNGSSLLIRRAALDYVGGYDPALRDRGAQGCEDYLLQILIARTWKVVCVPEYLTGYRCSPDAMSSDRARMARSHCAMLARVSRFFPDTPAGVLAASEAMARTTFGTRQLLRLRLVDAMSELWQALRIDPRTTLEIAPATAWRLGYGMVARRLRRLLPRAGSQRIAFLTMDPTAKRHTPPKPPLARQLAAVAGREAAFFAARPLFKAGPVRAVASSAVPTASLPVPARVPAAGHGS